jgi:phage terminase large subunit-like protein
MRRVGGIQQTRGGIPCRWYTSTTESGVADLAAGYGAIVEAVRASQDKFLRAQPMAGAWNEGRVLVPSSGEPWVDVFLNSMLDFTGIGDEADDPVDAAVAAYDVLVPEQVIQPVKLQVAPASPIVADRRWAESGGRGW